MSTTTSSAWAAPTGHEALIAIAMGQAEGLHPPEKLIISARLMDPNAPVPHRGNLALYMSVISSSIASVLVFLRLWMRARTAGGWALEDWLIIPGMGFMIACAGNTVFGVKSGGVGMHSWDLIYEEIDSGLLAMYLHLLFYVPATTFAKLSIIFFVRRLAGTTMTRGMSWLVWGNFWFTIIFNMTLMFLYSFQCLPVKSNYTLSLRFHPDTKCLSYAPIYYAGSIMHVISDFLLIAAPVKLVLGLQMTIKKKITVCFMLSIGGLAILCSVVRMGYILNFTSGTDVTWDAVEISIWGHLEVAFAVASACLPALRPLFTRVFPNFLTSRTSRSNTRSRGWTNDKLEGISGPGRLYSRTGPVRTDVSWKSGWSVQERRQHEWEVGRGSDTELVEGIELQKSDSSGSQVHLNGGILKTMSVDVSYEQPTAPDEVHGGLKKMSSNGRISPIGRAK